MDILLDTIFPKMCTSCNREGSHLCTDCLSLISIAPASSQLHPESRLSGLFSATTFQEAIVQKAMHMFKYPPFLKDLSQPFASLIVSHFLLADKPQDINRLLERGARHSKTQYLVCPMPLHSRRLRWRGFNQAEEIAKHLAEVLSLPLYTDILIRTKHTKPQVELKEQERRENVRGVFSVAQPNLVQNKNILLVDDVYTTGATMEECANVLRTSGARRVYGITVARG